MWLRCPRCQAETYERLGTHAHCTECNFSPDFLDWSADLAIPPWVFKFLQDTARNYNRLAKGGLKHQPALAEGVNVLPGRMA